MFYYLRNKYLQEYNFFNIWTPYCSINRTHIWKDKVFLSPLRNILVITSGCKHITHLLLDVRILLWVVCPVLSLRLVTEMTLMKIGGRDWLGSLGQKDPKEKWRLFCFWLNAKNVQRAWSQPHLCRRPEMPEVFELKMSLVPHGSRVEMPEGRSGFSLSQFP